MGNVKIKVSGFNKDVEQFLSVINNVFALMLKSPLLRNSQDEGVHRFVDLDPYALKSALKVQKQ